MEITAKITLRIFLTIISAYLFLAQPDAIGFAQTRGLRITIAGNGLAGFRGDGGPATMAQVFKPEGIALDSVGNLYIADTGNHRIRKVNHSGVISTVAGNGTGGFSGDGGPATSAQLFDPTDIAVDSAGNIYIADFNNMRIRKVTPDGMISTIAGGNNGIWGSNGIWRDNGDGGPATAALLLFVLSVAVDGQGNIYFSESAVFDGPPDRIRKVTPDGIISTVAGGGTECPGDGGPAILADIDGVSGIETDSTGNLYFTQAYRVRKVTPDGIISTVAGNGSRGYSGDGGPAISAQLHWPAGIEIDSLGNLYFAEDGNNCIRQVSTDGIISTVLADLNDPMDIELGSEGNLYIAERNGNRILEVRDWSTTNTTMYFPEVIAGGGWSTQITIINTGLAASSGTLVFKSPNSTPLAINAALTDSTERIHPANTGSIFPFTVPPGGTIFFSTVPSDNRDGVQTGWAQLEATGSLLSGMATYEFASNANTYCMFSVPQAKLLQFASIPVHNDDALGKETAYTIANPGSTPVSINLVLIDQTGAIVDDSVVLDIGPGQQIARYLWEDLDCPRFRGSLILFAQEGQPFVLLPIIEKQGLFTALPMAASQ